MLKTYIEAVIPKEKYTIQLEALDSKELPFIITQPEFMRRMKDMQQSGGNNMFGSMPEIHNVIINVNNDLVNTILVQNPRQKEKD